MATDALPPLYGTIPATVTVEVLLRDPSVRDESGSELAPEVASLTWQPVELAHEPEDCEPGFTLCSHATCMESWSVDYFLRIVENGVVVWVSPDHPDQSAAVA